MLVGVDLRDRQAPVNVGQVHEEIRFRGTAARGGTRGDRAFVKISRTGVKVGIRAIGYCSEFKVIAALRGSATSVAVLCSTISDGAVIDVSPRTAAVGAFPDTLIAIVRVGVPNVHF